MNWVLFLLGVLLVAVGNALNLVQYETIVPKNPFYLLLDIIGLVLIIIGLGEVIV